MTPRFLLAVLILVLAETIGTAVDERALAQQIACWTIIVGWVACWAWERRRLSTATSSRRT